MTKEELEALISRYLSGNATRREEQMIEDFFASQELKGPLDQQALGESMWTSIEGRIQKKDFADNSRGSGIRGRRLWFTASAAAALIATFAFFYFGNPVVTGAEEKPWVTLDAPYGQKSIVTLADGTRIFLNGGSIISYPEVFMPEKREVRLSGEAFFEVAPNPKQPFIVTSGDVVTKVLGTSFNIKAFPSSIVSVTVATGKVQVEAMPTTRTANGMDKRQQILAPNDQAVYDPQAGVFTVSEVDLEKHIAWKDNTLFFENTTLEDVAGILERWYNVSIVFNNDAIKGCRVNGKYKDLSLENVLKSIQYMHHIEFQFALPNLIELKGEGCNIQHVNSS